MPSIERTYEQLVDMARTAGAKRVLLFGSRARGSNLLKSDIDIAVAGCKDFNSFAEDVEEHLDSLLSVDIINLDEAISPELKREIERDKVVLYEEV